jgi:CubicO group peptidase (beta-lactamase class C family)
MRDDAVMQRTSPSEQGVDPKGISAFLDALERDPELEPHGLIIQRHGHRIAEGYWAPHTGDRPRLVYSLSKTFTGTAVALLVAEGRLRLDDLVSDHLPELFDGADARTRQLRVRHLVSLSTGHDRETILEAFVLDPADPVRGFFQIAPDEDPGTRFAYNQSPVLALATIVQRLAGERMVDYLRPRALEPLGIADLRWAQARPGLDMGFSGVHTNLDAIARLGQLYLDDGVWEGRRILPEGWVAEASSSQVDNPREPEIDWRQGYGFMLWQSRHGYRGDGAFGQFMVVLPEHDAVVAMFSCTEDMQAVLDLMWEHLLPAMGDRSSATPEDSALTERLAGLTLPTVAERRGGSAPEVPTMTFAPGAPSPSSHHGATSIDTAEGGLMTVREGDRSIEVPLTEGWTIVDRTTATSAARIDDACIAVDLAFLASPHRLEVELDVTTATFRTHWPLPPLFGAGIGHHLDTMRSPD